MYKILYQAYADEIKNLWQRSVFLATFMVLVWTGYGALQLKFIEKCAEISTLSSTYHLVSIGLCWVILILSLLWIAMAKGSKFVQEAHERHIQRYIKKHKCRIFCDLNTYERILNKKLCSDLVFCGTLKAYRYSPSKINIYLGWLSHFLACLLISYHIGFYAYYIYTKIFKWSDIYYLPYVITALIMLILAFLPFCVNSMIKNRLKGGNKQQ